MIADIKSYPAMKDSGVPWLGEVPEHWRLLRTKTLLRERVQKGFPDEPLLAATQTKGVVRKDQYENRTVLALKDLHLLKLVRAGDFVISLRSFQGGIEYAREQGIISPAYTVLYPAQPRAHGYLARLFKSKPYVENLSLYVTGIRQGQNIDYEKLSRSQLPVPPIPEQAAIVRFLDHADRRIRRYIAAKQKLIKLLEEQKQAIIHRAVTRGLDPNVHLKPSGVPWFGDVPEHWQVKAFTRCAVERADYRGATPTKTDSDVFLVTARNVRRGWIDYEVSTEFVAESDYAAIMRPGLPQVGDLLLTMEAPLGNAALVDREHIALAQRVVRFRFDPDEFVPTFVLSSILSPYFQNQLLCRATGSTALGIKASKLPELRLLCPPLPEQDWITKWMSRECAPLDRVRERAQGEIALLREFRTRLIADVVTGKLDVREAAARLPDEADEPVMLDEADMLAAGEEDGEGADGDAGIEEAES
jgi:type I restriction enzyme S subunit